MSINTQRLLDAKAMRFGTSAASTAFQEAFIEGLQRTLTDIQNFTGMTVTQVTSVSEDIDLDNAYYNAVSSGLDFYLQDTNLFTANPVADAENRFIRAMQVAQRVYKQSIDMTPRFGTLPPETAATNSEGTV
jgi:ribulose 1,5-bisphosphate carboxylase large subunit-like protein